MQTIHFVTHVTAAVDLERSQITDLSILHVGGADHLVSSTRFDGALTTWTIDGGLQRLDEVLFDGGDRPGGNATIMPVGDQILSGGGTGGALQTLVLQADGTFGAATTLTPLPYEFTGIQHGVTVTLPNGAAVFAGFSGQSGIARIDFDPAGTMVGHQTLSGGQITSLAEGNSGNQQFLFSADGENTVTSWTVAENGDLTVADERDPDDG